MNDWLEWNGVRSTTLGMHVLTQPSIIRAAERSEYVPILGRPGSLRLLEGDHVYDDITLVCTCVIDDPDDSRIENISGWLSGMGMITFANRPEGFYIGHVSNQIGFDKIVRGNPHMSFQIQFRCQPFIYLFSGMTTRTASGAATSFTNLGNVPAAPLLKIKGSGEGTIMWDNKGLLIHDFSGLSYIMVDCDAKMAYKGERGNPSDPLVLLGTRVSGDWLQIPTGTSNITMTSKISSVEVTPRWRCMG